MAPAPAPACCCSIFPELGASTATRAASLAHRAGIYSNVEQQMLKLSNISRYPQSKARLQNDSRNSASHFEQFTATPQQPQTDGPRPRPLVAVVVVANDTMLLLIF